MELIIEWNKGLYKDLRKNLRMFFEVNSWLERRKKKQLHFLRALRNFAKVQYTASDGKQRENRVETLNPQQNNDQC